MRKSSPDQIDLELAYGMNEAVQRRELRQRDQKKRNQARDEALERKRVGAHLADLDEKEFTRYLQRLQRKVRSKQAPSGRHLTIYAVDLIPLAKFAREHADWPELVDGQRSRGPIEGHIARELARGGVRQVQWDVKPRKKKLRRGDDPLDAFVEFQKTLSLLFRMPIRIEGGTDDKNSKKRNHNGNGLGRLLGAVNGRKAYCGQQTRRIFEESFKVLRIERTVKGPYKVGRRKYPSDSRRYKRHFVQCVVYLPRWQYDARPRRKNDKRPLLAELQPLVRALYRAKPGTPAGDVVQLLRKKARSHRKVPLYVACAWSRFEREEAALQKRTLPRLRIANLANVISPNPSPKREGSQNKKDAGSARQGEPLDGEVLPPITGTRTNPHLADFARPQQLDRAIGERWWRDWSAYANDPRFKPDERSTAPPGEGASGALSQLYKQINSDERRLAVEGQRLLEDPNSEVNQWMREVAVKKGRTETSNRNGGNQ